MRNYLLLKSALSLALLVFVCTSVASAATYQITGHVVDINGNGIPGAKVSLFNKGVLAPVDSSNPTYTIESGAEVGTYTFDSNLLPDGNYQIIAEIGGKQSSTMLQVGENYSSYTVKTIAMTNYAVPSTGSPAQATPAPTPTPTPVATPTEVSSPTAPAIVNASVIPSETAATPSASSTPVPTPGLMFTFIPALLVICLIAIRKHN